MAGNTAGSIIIDIVAKTGELQTDVDRAQSSIHRLQRELQKFQKETAASGNEFKKNFIGPLREGENVLKSYQQNVGKTTDTVSRLGRGMQQNQGSFRSANQIIQNTSYQLTDFVVQVQGGVSAMRAFSQQAPQFLGAFGPMGAALGLFAALGGAFIPMAAEALKGANAAKSLEDSQKSLNDALTIVNATAQSFDMTNMIDQFNKADANVRRSIINLMEYRRTAAEIAMQETNTALQSQLKELVQPTFLGRMTGNFQGVDLGINPNVAKDLFAEIRSGTTEAQVLAQKYGSELLKGNEKARELAATLNKVALDTQSFANASSSVSKFLDDAAKAGERGKIPIQETAKAVKELLSPMESWRKSVTFAVNDASLLVEKIKEMAAMIEGAAARGVEANDPAFRAMIAQYEAVANAWTKLMQGPKQLKEKMSEEMKVMQQITQNFAQQFSDTLVNGLMAGKLAFDDFARSIISMIMKIMINRAVISFLNAFLPGAGDSGPVITPMGDSFAEGGYTGDGGKYQPAGVVHAGEFVMNKEATSRIGVGNLYRMMRGYADGGLVGSAPLAGAGMGGGQVNINIKNEGAADGYQATATARKNETGLDVEILVRKVMADDLRRNGPMAQQMTNTFGLRRSM